MQTDLVHAVPTMHQAILSRAGRNRETIDQVPLRFVRSSSSSLPPQIMAELEEVFGAPVIESYGMTEAAIKWRAIPCPPSRAKPEPLASPPAPMSGL